MTEREWMECADPAPMLEFLRGKASERKLRLYLVASARSVWNKMSDETMRRAVDMAEQYADGRISAEEHRAAHDDLYRLRFGHLYRLVEPAPHRKAKPAG